MVAYDDKFYQKIEDDMWSSLGINLGGYNSAVCDELIAVVKHLAGAQGHGSYSTNIADELGMKETHVELILYILCSANWADYGVSPRGCWIDYGIDRARLLSAIDTWYENQWQDVPYNKVAAK